MAIQGTTENPTWVMVMGGVGIALGGLVLFLGLRAGGGASAISLAVGLTFLYQSVRLLLRGLRRKVAELAFSDVTLELDPVGVPLGGVLQGTLHLTPAKPVVITQGAFVVRTIERAEYKAGTDSRTYQQTIYEERHLLKVPAQLDASASIPIEIPIPTHIPPSWTGRYNRLTTQGEVQLALEGWPDLHFAQEFKVRAEVVDGQ
jgi:hypothetical protein